MEPFFNWCVAHLVEIMILGVLVIAVRGIGEIEARVKQSENYLSLIVEKFSGEDEA